MSRYLRNSYTYIFIFSLLLCPDRLIALSQSPRDLLQEALKVETNLPPVMMELEVLRYHAVDEAAGRNSGSKQKIRFFKNGKKFDVTSDIYFREADEKDGPFKHSSNNRIIWDESRTTMRRTGDKATEGYVRNEKPTIGWRVRAPYLHGILNYGDNHFASELLKSANLKIQPQKQTIDGFSCYVIEGEVNNKHYAVWIDAQNGFLYRKAIVKEIFDPPYIVEELGKSLTSRTFETSAVKIEAIEGNFVITEAKQVVRNAYTDGTTDQDRHEAKRVSIKWHPDFDSMGAFKMEMPDGTYVRDLDYGIKYVWQDGKLQAATDQDTLDEIEGAVRQLKTERDPLLASKESVTGEPVEPAGADIKKTPVADSEKTTHWGLFVTTLFVLGVISILVYNRIRGKKGHVNQ